LGSRLSLRNDAIDCRLGEYEKLSRLIAKNAWKYTKLL